jgi:hypothetical protein
MEKKLTAFLQAHWGILIACLLTIFALLPLFSPGFFPMHDDEQVGRLYDLDLALKAGHIPPRMAANIGFGYGYPLFNFYPSFVYYVAEIFVILGFSYITSIKLMIAAGFLVTAIFMYRFAREYFGVFGGVVSAVAYTYAPYHALDVYVRGALPEFWSFAFIPALFWSFKKLQETGLTRYLVYSSLFICFLILTHNLVALMSAFFIGSYVLYLLWTTGERKRFFLQVVLSGITGLLLSAYFWIPSYFEKSATMIELLTTELADYRQHFVYLRQLWSSPWGYGGSLYGLYDGLSFQVGKAHILLSLAAVISVIFAGLKKKQTASIVILFCGFLLLSVFLMTFYSQFLWESIQQFSYIQFPWRFLLFASFSASFLIGGIFVLRLSKTVSAVLAAGVIAVLIGVNVMYFQPAKYLTEVTDTDYISPEVIRWRTSIMAFEYVPRGVATKTSAVGTTVIDIEENETAQGTYQIVKGNVTVSVLSDKPQEKRLSLTASEPSVLRLNTFSFPGWKVYLDNREVSYTDTNKLKLITLSIPQGAHTLRAVFTDTSTRRAGNIGTLIGLIILASIIGKSQIMKKHRGTGKNRH